MEGIVPLLQGIEKVLEGRDVNSARGA